MALSAPGSTDPTASGARPGPGGETSAGKAPSRRKLVIFGLLLAAVSLFMYVSFIVKTAVRGP